MNPGILLISGMKSSCIRRAASFESVTPSYRRTVKYALLLMVMILRLTYFFSVVFPEPFWGSPSYCFIRKWPLQGGFVACVGFDMQRPAMFEPHKTFN